MAKILRITARPEKGFRRCGIDHPPSPVDHDARRFNAEAIEKLKAEPNLVVQEIDAPEPKAAEPKGDGKSNGEGGDGGAEPKPPAEAPAAPTPQGKGKS